MARNDINDHALAGNRDAASDVPTLTFQERLVKLNQAPHDMARQISQHLYGLLSESLDKAGQAVDQKGKPLDPEAVFSVLEKIQLKFDSTGRHKPFSLVIPPALTARAKQVFQEIESDPELQNRFRSIMQQKKPKWRDREAARKLVG